MLTLTNDQVRLLIAMTSPHRAHLKDRYVYIAECPYPLADLYVLRAAGLVRVIGPLPGARSHRRFMVTERGAVEALRLDSEAALGGREGSR